MIDVRQVFLEQYLGTPESFNVTNLTEQNAFLPKPTKSKTIKASKLLEMLDNLEKK